jgi:hypothetical protein
MSKKLKPREILADRNNLTCICKNTDCEWHGNCKDCVALHRYHATIPNCLDTEIERQKGIKVDFIDNADYIA